MRSTRWIWLVAALACGGIAASNCSQSSGGADGGEDMSALPPDMTVLSDPSAHCAAPERPPQASAIKTQRVFPNLTFDDPVLALQAPGDPSSWYVVQQPGKVVKFPNQDATTMVTDFVDVTADMAPLTNETGLLGMAFHPKYATTTKQFFLFYSAKTNYVPYKPDENPDNLSIRSTVARFSVAANGTVSRVGLILPPSDAGDAAHPNPLDKPYFNHNGGNIAFGNDGYLYVGFGDGGLGGDPKDRAQNLNLFFGKMVRIDIDTPPPAGQRYVIPPTNPFASKAGGLPELYAWGFRNPWRWSFDAPTGDLWVGDVGQGAHEEVDKVTLGGNYGWNLKEGFSCFKTTPCDGLNVIDPVVDYPNPAQGIAVTGGYVYRGSAIPSLVGSYIFADYGNGKIRSIAYDPLTGAASVKELFSSGLLISSFAQDADGELYVLDHSGTNRGMFKIVAAGGQPPDTFPKTLTTSGCFSTSNAAIPAGNLILYQINAPLWSDGAAKRRWLGLPDGGKVHIAADGHWDLPVGTVMVKEFSLGGQRVETRLLIHHSDGDWAGYSYEWNDAQTEATLLASSKNKMVNGQTWHYPSRDECLGCHTTAAGRTLGLWSGQLNRDVVGPDGSPTNQVALLEQQGLFDAPLLPLDYFPPLSDTTASVESQAKAYLHANCSHCHRPMGPGQGMADFRFSQTFKQMMVCNVTPTEGDLGVSGAKLLVPGMPAKSILSLHMHALDATRMPRLASSVVDPDGTALIDRWISSVTACPP